MVKATEANGGFSFAEAPTLTRTRDRVATEQDKGIEALIGQASGTAIVEPVATDVIKQRAAWTSAARRAGRKARTLVLEGSLYITLR